MMKTIINSIVNEKDKRIQVYQAMAEAAATQTDRQTAASKAVVTWTCRQTDK